MRVLVYSAVFGAYDAPSQHAPQTIQADFVRFSEENNPYLPSWFEDSHPRLKAKFYKLSPYVLDGYRNYDYVIWIDGSGTLLSPDSLESLIRYCQTGYTVFQHPARDCIYDEADFCKDFEKYREEPIDKQVAMYRSHGYPAHNGLYACGFIIRRTSADYRTFDAAWLRENLRWSYQDQLSFPYLLWKMGRTVDVIDLPLVGNNYVRFHRDNWKV